MAGKEKYGDDDTNRFTCPIKEQYMQKLETDYLVIGSGAMGMAFCDSLITETNANIIIVDKHHQPGGHWNDVYPCSLALFSLYGVNSKRLGNNTIDATGLNKGHMN